MTIVTRHALRVYATLSGLKPDQGGDVIDALIPFMEPILELMHGKVFDPDLLALGVRRLYGWRFNRDVAEQFAGRLLAKGYLKRAARNVFVVQFEPRPEARDGQIEIATILERVTDEFESFPPKVTDLFQFDLGREELKEVLIRFLVSLDAYTEEAFVQQVERMKLDLSHRTLLDQLDEGGEPLTAESRYLCARFVKHLVKQKPEFVPHLARLASIALLTEVVEDFIKPTAPVTRSDLTLVLDAPVALNLLGLSGAEAQRDIGNVVESLRALGCSFVAFPVSCEEMSRNLASMLANSPPDRHGPTHDAMRKGEVAEDFVRSVMNNPERALQAVGVTVRPIDLHNFPSGARHFDRDTYEDFLGGIMWKHGSIDAREHDATCAALTMRLRSGVRSADPLTAKFAFVTTNAMFVRYAREFCRKNRMINERQVPPVLLQRELSTTAWLRTGLTGAADELRREIPRSHLIASCERVLRPRQEVVRAVHDRLKEFAPEKTVQYELLLADQRSVQRLMDETLNVERLVTPDSAEKLLDEMRRATAEDVQEEYGRKLRQQAQRHGKQKKEMEEQAAANLSAEREAAAASLRAEREATAAALAEKERELRQGAERLANIEAERERFRRDAIVVREREVGRVDEVISRVSRTSRRLERAMLGFLYGLAAVAFGGSTLGVGADRYAIWSAIVAMALIGGYHTVQELRQKPKFGFQNILDWAARRGFRKRLADLHLDGPTYEDAVEIEYGQVRWREGFRERLSAPSAIGAGKPATRVEEALPAA
ncbi:UNVERIFIED_ORG: hypothetical protein M2438_002925 [Methylobacterium sp. SuP10 SLI 274]|uniref:hypothetical protein n=1 Tax=Methylorubrum extorquens TaxID=408 RepID=UPI00209F4F16|nr:hypothetical protein [Methylorubrum extorquens]MDF9864157.1 hypothetical protein [Methylorubrum pseudosasae]MDH6637750.1 hypothetical protein [Methylobacterium sp. SuP10 SLI 274]MDH6666929.1 hypothetical protein [Methylorubrum zatmanii]MCP1558835.1 hypothetical protein [Methylorubrum extorquens]MDF9792469.1 hypothetical protein [Methylorubrum extorquens]